MATGDIFIFNEAMEYMLDGGWATTDDIRLAICDNTTTPTIADPGPALGSGGTTNYTEVGAAGSYTTNGTSLGTWATIITQTDGVTKLDSTVNPNWPLHVSNDIDAWWAVMFNDTQAGNPALGFVELGGPVNMQAGELRVTWSDNGIFTIS